MPLESTIVCLDVSEWMRNGDYTPTRADAQYDAAAMICGVKVDQNPENTVGVLTAGGKGVKLLTSPTEDIGKLLSCLHGLRPEGPAAFVGGIKTAMIALKHRKNKHGGQRVVAFVGSPVDAEPSALKALGAILKKNNIALDVVCLGENEANGPALEALVGAADSNGNSHLLIVPPGVLPSDVLATSALVLGEDAMGGGAGVGAGGAEAGASPAAPAGGRFAEYGGIDPSMDPELAMALRISMEEARSAAESAGPPATPAGAGASSSTSSAAPASAGLAAPSPIITAGTPAQEAGSSTGLTATLGGLAVSTNNGRGATPAPTASSSGLTATLGGMAVDDDEDDALLAQALALSQAQAPPLGAPPAAATPAPAAPGGGFLDPSFALGILGGLEGVDVNDPEIQAALAALGAGGQAAPKPPGEGDKK